MRLNNIKFLLPVFALFLMSCPDEPAPPATEKEIIAEISREWTCHEEGDDFPLNYNATITSDPANDSKILISNFHAMGNDDKISAIIKTDLSVEIPLQTINSQDFSGTGEISNDYTQITWDYTIVFSGGTVHITGTYTYGTTS
ncbi:MAG: hypothetical protein K8R54_09120 [Bacteroidales bacterium]|nr:hypothetical protein [Bacteroidales bacterium]